MDLKALWKEWRQERSGQRMNAGTMSLRQVAASGQALIVCACVCTCACVCVYVLLRPQKAGGRDCSRVVEWSAHE